MQVTTTTISPAKYPSQVSRQWQVSWQCRWTCNISWYKIPKLKPRKSDSVFPICYCIKSRDPKCHPESDLKDESISSSNSIQRSFNLHSKFSSSFCEDTFCKELLLMTPTTVLFRTTLTQAITQYELLILLGSKFSREYHYTRVSVIPLCILLHYMALSHKDWELPKSRTWLAEMDIDRGLDC